jgi:hypothetical protein
LSSFFTPLLAKGEATIWSLFTTHPLLCFGKKSI